MSLKKYCNVSKVSNQTLNTSTASQQRIAPPCTMPVNKTFHNKLVIRKLQFKTKTESHKLNGRKLRRNQTGKTIQKVDLDNSRVSSGNEKFATRSNDERNQFNNTMRIANLKPILQKIKLEK